MGLKKVYTSNVNLFSLAYILYKANLMHEFTIRFI